MAKYLLQNYLDHSFGSCPEKPALVGESGAISYASLYADANRISRCLRGGGVKRHDRVVICMKRSAQVVLAMMGVIKADAVYVPVDAKAPLERIAGIIADCRPSALICDGPVLQALSGAEQGGRSLQGVRLALVFGTGGDPQGIAGIPCVYTEDLAGHSPEATRCDNIDADPAYILYTSGSTGAPKGVVVSHLNVINYIEWASECFRIGADDRILGTAPFHFDMSTFDIFAALKAGGTLCIVPERHLLFPNKLLETIEKEEITLWKGVSSLLMYLSSTGSLKEGRIPSLTRVLFGGEVLPTKHLMNWMKVYPSKNFYNVYGPTEATGISAYYQVEKAPATAEEAVPIGRACANTEILILADGDRVAGAGEAGELCIRGSGLSLGYWNDEEKTARAFVRNPLGDSQHDRIYRTGDQARMREDGLIEYLGRKDFQVKHMGYRIEMFEVEKAILAQENVQQAAVLLCPSVKEEVSELIAFIEAQETVDTDAVWQALGRSLPTYMLPKRIIALQRIPVNDRGKTDRAALQDYYRALLQEGRGGGPNERTGS